MVNEKIMKPIRIMNLLKNKEVQPIQYTLNVSIFARIKFRAY